jgi:hypothetical protein
MKKHEHKWIVFSTALVNAVIMVECECGAYGIIEEYTQDEWSKAFYAPSNPYKWHDNNRVIIK